MTQTDETPEKEDVKMIHELSESGPMWKKIAQLVGDEELAREVFIQLKDAIQSSAIQKALSTDRQCGPPKGRGRVVGVTAKAIAAKLAPRSGLRPIASNAITRLPTTSGLAMP